MARRNVLFRQHLNRSLAGNIAVFLCLLLFGVFFAFPVVFAINTAFKPLNEILVFPPRFLRSTRLEKTLSTSKVVAEFWCPCPGTSLTACSYRLWLPSATCCCPVWRHTRWRTIISRQQDAEHRHSLEPAVYSYGYLHTAVRNTGKPENDKHTGQSSCRQWSSLGLYLMRSFMMGIPKEMLEAARIDGASEKRTYFSIVMPNVKPAALTLIIFSFQSIWNYVGGSAVYAEQLKGLPALLQSIAAAGVARSGVTAAATVLLMIPPVLIFILSQNNVIETMSTSGLK